ncbi:hypothetical protein ASF16_10975 [Acidovorax sp. Leaf78]|nr:hypothetical protein ASF16_10975 [Acidovorax sp. Leaf78]
MLRLRECLVQAAHCQLHVFLVDHDRGLVMLEGEIIWMMMRAALSTPNISAATPTWLRSRAHRGAAVW